MFVVQLGMGVGYNTQPAMLGTLEVICVEESLQAPWYIVIMDVNY